MSLPFNLDDFCKVVLDNENLFQISRATEGSLKGFTWFDFEKINFGPEIRVNLEDPIPLRLPYKSVAFSSIYETERGLTYLARECNAEGVNLIELCISELESETSDWFKIIRLVIVLDSNFLLHNVLDESCLPFSEPESEHLRPLFAAFIYCLRLISCKNVIHVDNILPFSRQRKKRNSAAVESYKTLILDGKVNQKSVKSSQDDSNAWHMCRGHFKHYTPESPLFGRHTGTYWWPHHVRGNERNGKVSKNYRLSANLNSTSYQ